MKDNRKTCKESKNIHSFDTKKKQIDIIELGNSLFNKDFEDFIDRQPYMAFVIMSAMLEFLAKCSKHVFNRNLKHNEIINEIKNIKVLKKYTQMKFVKGEDIYSVLRCGMVHSLIPDQGIKLTKDTNDLCNMTIGANEFYADLNKAWQVLKQNASLNKFNALQIDETTSSRTPYFNSL